MGSEVQTIIFYKDDSLFSKDIEAFLTVRKVNYITSDVKPAKNDSFLCIGGKDIDYFESIEWLNNYNKR